MIPKPAAVAAAPQQPQRVRQLHTIAGTTMCSDMRSLNKSLAMHRAGSYMLPDGCTNARSFVTRLLRDERQTMIPGVVVIEAGPSAALIARNDLIFE